MCNIQEFKIDIRECFCLFTYLKETGLFCVTFAEVDNYHEVMKRNKKKTQLIVCQKEKKLIGAPLSIAPKEDNALQKKKKKKRTKKKN